MIESKFIIFSSGFLFGAFFAYSGFLSFSSGALLGGMATYYFKLNENPFIKQQADKSIKNIIAFFNEAR